MHALARMKAQPMLRHDEKIKATEHLAMNRKVVLWISTICVLYLGVELVSLLGLFLLRSFRHIEYVTAPSATLSDRHREILSGFLQGNPRYFTISPELGWTIKKNGVAPLYRANSQGIRGDREYTSNIPAGVIRISSFGDSYTHCDDVANSDTWQQQLQQMDSGLEVLNFGVGGFGLDQAFLRYQEETERFPSNIVFIGYMTENIFRHVNVFRPFYLPATSTPLSKPRFALHGGKLTLLENPMQDYSAYEQLLAHPKTTLSLLGKNDHFFDTIYNSSKLDFLPSYRLASILTYLYLNNTDIIVDGNYNTESEAFQVTLRLLDEFYASARKNDALPVILIFPEPADVIRYQQDSTRQYSALIDYLNMKKYSYIDLLDIFANLNKPMRVEKLFAAPGFNHYSPLANRHVAQAIWQYLQQEGLLDQTAGLDFK